MPDAALVQFGFSKALIVIVAYLIINTITDNIISPREMGQGLDISPLAVFISLAFWAWVLRLVGAIMAVPLLLIMKMLLGRYDDTRWLAVALSGDHCCHEVTLSLTPPKEITLLDYNYLEIEKIHKE